MKMLAVVAAAASCLLLLVGPASADVGVERADRHSGQPGEEVHLTLACGFCFPPCVGPKGERRPEGFAKGPCMLGTHRPPPASFGVSLLPRERAERLLDRLIACGADPGTCPAPTGAPRRGAFRYLGEALPPPGGNNPEHGDPPRYLLDFEIPRLAAGRYTYVIWCDACAAGPGGSLVIDPASPRWRLDIAAPGG